MSPTLSVLVIGALVGASCATIGSFLVLRRMALLGDAISHAVLPGIALAFLFTGDRSALPMVLGAGALGVLTVLLVELLNRSRRLKEDASIGVVFPALFSVGVLIISRYASSVHLDLDCVLYGEIAYTPWDLLFWGSQSFGPKALWVTGGVLVVNALFVGVFYKELKISTFDPELAASLGFSPTLLHYGLMTAVSLTVVGSFESVG
ncbi:MAG TPA: metal ABC transporter permease, partial [Thermoanaerobaculia bacterium]|nr:metal ABC transporter permease [Thermoanaerobaculia bacterium]